MSEKFDLFKYILSDENIFNAIYSVESYISEKKLLSVEDAMLLQSLRDKYNSKLISEIIKECREKLDYILQSEELFEIDVYFKIKKWDGKVIHRPIHSANLITQICIVCLLNTIMFKPLSSGKKQLSEISQLIPSNFYGNIPCTEPERIFYKWQVKYKDYTEHVIKEYKDAKMNHTYKYEVALDIENFFPSVNPKWIMKFILDKVSTVYSEENLKKVRIVLEKLLYFKIKNIESIEENYYDDVERQNLIYINYRGNSIEYNNLGIPQGLPQSYFMGNICMLLLKPEFEKIFPGKLYFYVDDSVIYTNNENATEENFFKSIVKLDKNINMLLNVKDGDIYKIKIHNDEKSTTSQIENNSKLDKSFLLLIAKETSGIGYDINNTIESLEDVIIQEKIARLETAVETELKNIKEYKKNNIEKEDVKAFSEIYSKSLIRYKKFFRYRRKILNYRNDKNIQEIRNEFETNYLKKEIKNNAQIEQIIENINEDNFLAEACLIFNHISDDKNKNDFICKMKKLEKSISKNIPDDNLYFYNNLKNVPNLNIGVYDTLDLLSKQKILSYAKKNILNVVDEFEDNISKRKEIQFKLGYGNGYDKWLYNNSNEYERRILNAYISRLFNVELSDDVRVYRKDGRPLSYYELCVFAYVRNKYCDCSKFLIPSQEFIDDKIDYSIYEVMDIFIKYVKSTEYVNTLIIVHKYISSIWKNGSRFLYFYTLHNQEHSIELIKRTTSLCRMIDYFQLKMSDYYILFLCCYLHDVSMALQPDPDIFVADSEMTDCLANEFKSKVIKEISSDEASLKDVKRIMKEAFECVNAYFENIARGKHAESSASMIRTHNDFKYLSESLRSLVAEISVAHSYDTIDVYDLKSNAKNDCVSTKYIMILLRIADLVDGAKDRVSLNILKHNINNMPAESKFHWVTHAVTDGFDIHTKYQIKDCENKSNSGFISILNEEHLKETIIVKIKVNEHNLTKVSCKECKNTKSILDMDNNEIRILLGNDNVCEPDKCNFLCKWMVTKNNYLLTEMYALQQYLERNNSNLFDTSVHIIIDFEKATSLNSIYYEIVNARINK